MNRNILIIVEVVKRREKLLIEDVNNSREGCSIWNKNGVVGIIVRIHYKNREE